MALEWYEAKKNPFFFTVDDKIEIRVLEYLNQIKSKHSKVMDINHETLQMQNYLEAPNQVNSRLSKFIFHARTRMLDVKHNFKNKHINQNKNCPLGCSVVGNQEHLLNKLGMSCVSNQNSPHYEDLFDDDSNKQFKIAAWMKDTK